MKGDQLKIEMLGDHERMVVYERQDLMVVVMPVAGGFLYEHWTAPESGWTQWELRTTTFVPR